MSRVFRSLRQAERRRGFWWYQAVTQCLTVCRVLRLRRGVFVLKQARSVADVYPRDLLQRDMTSFDLCSPMQRNGDQLRDHSEKI